MVRREAKANGGTLRLAARLMRFAARGEGARIGLGMGTILLSTLLALVQPWPLKLVFDWVMGTGRVPASIGIVASWVGGGHPKIGLLVVLCIGLLLIQLLMGLLTVWSTYLLVSIGLRMVFRLRCALFDHIQRLSLRFHDQTTVGDSLYRVTWDSYCVQAIFNSGLVPAVTAMVTLLGIGIVLWTRDWLVMAVAVGVGVPLALLVRWMDRPMNQGSMRVREHESQISQRVQETLSGIRAVQAFGREDLESQRFRAQAELSLNASLRLTIMQVGSQAVVALLMAGGMALVVWIGVNRVLQGRLTPGDVLLMVAYLSMLLKPLETLAYTATQAQGSIAGAQRVFAILDEPAEVNDAPRARELQGRASGKIEFIDVGFGYRRHEPVLNQINLQIQPGQTVALVGASGVGKTTLVSLLMRFYDPWKGQILLDGAPISDLTLRSLRQNIALVLQEPVLFCASIAENIAYGRPGATARQIESAARAAGVDEFVRKLPQRYDTQVGQRGVALSGGQRQRLSIARAFLKDAPVLVMDEPTSALDSRTEAKLLAAMECLKKGRTTIIIAHRLSTIRGADLIVAMQDGQIVERGTHDELIERAGAYAGLYQSQFGMPLTGVAHE